MRISIRKFLLINVLIAITVITLLTAVGNYYLNQKDIQEHMDAWLMQSALSLQALLSDKLENRNLHIVQAELNRIPEKVGQLYQKPLERYTRYIYHGKFQFQVWGDQGILLLRSINAPAIPLSSGSLGFSNKTIDHQLWRIFTTHNPELKVSIVIAERFDTRYELANRIAKDDIFIMLLAFPIAGLLIWIIIGKGLESLPRVASEVSQRAPSYLEPVDLTGVPVEIKPLVDELNKLLLRLQQGFEREKRFAADAAHELRTPLAALKTQTQVALNANSEEARRSILHNIITGVDRCAHVVQQLLTLSRVVPEAVDIYDSTTVNICKLSAEVIAHLAPSALEKNIDIELYYENEDLSVKGNVTALSILLRNLIDNAIRYTPPNGEVKVSISTKDDRIGVHVVDNGPGIPAELRTRVFERFYRILGNKSPGSGLGLAIVQQIAKLHQADLHLGTPLNGKGLEVEISFPSSSR